MKPVASQSGQEEARWGADRTEVTGSGLKTLATWACCTAHREPTVEGGI